MRLDVAGPRQLPGGEVERDRLVGPPCVGGAEPTEITGGPIETPTRELGRETHRVDARDEERRRDRAELRVAPPHERLAAEDLAVDEAANRLIPVMQLVACDRALDVAVDARHEVGLSTDRPVGQGDPAPRPLRAIHRQVGFGQQALGGVPVGSRHGNADARSGDEVGAASTDRLLAGGEQSGRDLHRISLAATAPEHHEELIAAQPTDDVITTNGRAEAVGDLPEHRVAGDVAVHVVHQLEAVEVDEEDRRGLARTAEARSQHVDHCPSAEQARQFIGGGDRLHSLHLGVDAEVRSDQPCDAGEHHDMGGVEAVGTVMADIERAVAVTGGDQRHIDRRAHPAVEQHAGIGLGPCAEVGVLVEPLLAERLAGHRVGDRELGPDGDGGVAVEGVHGQHPARVVGERDAGTVGVGHREQPAGGHVEHALHRAHGCEIVEEPRRQAHIAATVLCFRASGARAHAIDASARRRRTMSVGSPPVADRSIPSDGDRHGGGDEPGRGTTHHYAANSAVAAPLSIDALVASSSSWAS